MAPWPPEPPNSGVQTSPGSGSSLQPGLLHSIREARPCAFARPFRLDLHLPLDGERGASAVHVVRREAFEKAGYFDERLSSREDWDMCLRLSFHFPFVFVPGLVAVYLPSPRGLWQGDHRKRENIMRVVSKAVQMMPDSPPNAELKRTALARTSLRYAESWPEILTSLRTYPFVIRHHWARAWVGNWMCKLALRSESPASTLLKLCAEMKEATFDPRVTSCWRVRQTAAKSWALIASALAVHPMQQREAAFAATHAVSLSPLLIVRGALAPIIVRGALGSFGGTFRHS